MDFIRNNKYIILILFLAFVLLFFNLGKPDMEGDQSAYAFRSIGYMDYLGSDKQTTPLQWFDEIPWWSKLSFHDHPPLVFIFQHFSIKIFGVSAFSARLPSALAGFLTIFFIYLIGRELYSKQVGLWSALVLTVSNYLIWISRTALLEAVAIFFIVLSIYFFIKAWSKTKYLFLWAVALGLAFLSKYTTFYLIPVYFIFILFKKRPWLKEKNFWLSLILIILIFSPVIFYNLTMFYERGHFDVQFSALFGQSKNDWPLVQTAADFNFKGIFKDIFNVLSTVYSPISLLLFILAFSFFVYQKENRHKFFIISLFVLSLIGAAFLGANNRYLSVISVHWALIAGFFLSALLKLFHRRKALNFIFIFILALFLSVDLLYTINTNILPISFSKKFELAVRPAWIGYNQLDGYFQDKFSNQCSSRAWIRGPVEINIIKKFSKGKCQINDQSLIVYDDKMDWFETLWVFDKLRIYNNLPVFHAGALAQTIQGGEEVLSNVSNFREFYFISLENLESKDKYASGDFDFFKKQILEQKPDLEPDIINAPDGSISFKIYKITDNKLEFY
ncbi:MAG: hypothetical protein A3A94_02530 [Candidatus Portnoybacteria bacterium RIFCSPLOWO2_01_FULL_43_11]|uniref:Glycosyltransferase RgtA/B/C/D-like domain-containing protein n=4 Tax=Candidatus Portnoyibacteriota TaxID=1817913 RepID=A0A1G2FBX8_9BACT|nr:MAG: hypothetical protein A2815_00770 [Candidatus Portnoybacteria bacterium RIFCSPHIGHO2_01_FULL_40_12b]OGZ38211.1 MAG: hypothetical protein A3E90_00575 [Candidatus Portnoybacteria bacterium RIFCSPHIGHO2_12_FULL_40_11]OGZ38675.1 MAG: hypothetical protein A3A94_02530 [Candidatus Portnoybacteria bacterium RIFCSPLOWO2_01_FULL_43_11]OGZ41044.1 MAG: hypothetical protein A3I20_01210 [Candidatus Portnoybacteria bacterium RIFCSPLOWO2_02_FULL_40_15]